jgi:AAA15 family ATPase/GTPase
MLIRFVVSNFMSFKDETEFNMLPAKGNGSRQLTNHIKKTKSGVEVLKTAAIYGANAAGKSNLIKAIEFLKELITDEYYFPSVTPNQRFRLDNNYKSKPSTFRIECDYNNIHYDYAIELKKGKITQEWLYVVNSVKKTTETLIFERKNKIVTFGEFKMSKKNNLTYIKEFLKNELDDNIPVLKLLRHRVEGSNIFDEIYRSFLLMRIVDPESKSFEFMQSLSTNKKSREFVEGLLSNSNTGIEKIKVEEIDIDNFFSYEDSDTKERLIDTLENEIEISSENYIPFRFKENLHILKKIKKKYFVTILKTKHFSSENLFNFNEESDGTNRLFELIPAFEELLEVNNSIYFIDELERSMHPILAKEMLRLFSENSKNNSQLIFTTHESHLLDDNLLRRDEIWFTEKKSDGSTEFYPLSNFNPRGDKVLERGYLEGRYGGIPFLGDFSKLITEENLL